jgi:hypothetical protein
MARIVSTLYLVPSSYAANPSRPRLRSRRYGAAACDVYYAVRVPMMCEWSVV